MKALLNYRRYNLWTFCDCVEVLVFKCINVNIFISEANKGMEAVAEHINEMQKIFEEYGTVFDELSKVFKDTYPHKRVNRVILICEHVPRNKSNCNASTHTKKKPSNFITWTHPHTKTYSNMLIAITIVSCLTSLLRIFHWII